MARLLMDLRIGDRVSGLVHACIKCGKWFIGRVNAEYCSDACRQAAHRERRKRDE